MKGGRKLDSRRMRTTEKLQAIASSAKEGNLVYFYDLLYGLIIKYFCSILSFDLENEVV